MVFLRLQLPEVEVEVEVEEVGEGALHRLDWASGNLDCSAVRSLSAMLQRRVVDLWMMYLHLLQHWDWGPRKLQPAHPSWCHTSYTGTAVRRSLYTYPSPQ